MSRTFIGQCEGLACERIQVASIASEGALDNLAHLRAGTADVGFVRGGMADPVADTEAGIVSLGSPASSAGCCATRPLG
jgi:hypothetical protein